MALILTGCISPSPTVTQGYNGGKHRITCQLEKSGGSNHTVSNINISGDPRLSIISIAGVAYTGPTGPPMSFQMRNNSAPVPIVFELDLTGSTIGDTFSSTFNLTASGGGSFTEDYDFETIDPSNIVTGDLILGFVPIGMSNNKTLVFTNDSDFDLVVDVTNSCNFPANTDLTVNQPDPFVVPSGGGVVNWTLTWTPTVSNPGSIDCAFNFGYAEEILQHSAFVTGSSSDPSVALSFTNIEIITDSGFLPTVDNLQDANLCDPYTAGAIGEGKRIVYHLNYTNGFADGATIYFNPYLYGDDCNFARELYDNNEIDSPPVAGYYIEFCTGMGTVPMKLIGIGTNENNNQNISAQFVEVDAFNAKVQLDFYLTEDLDFPVTDKTVPNQPRLLKNHINATNELVNEVQSVYSVEKKICALIYLVDPNILFAGKPIEGYVESAVRCSFRFYNKGLFDKPGTPVASEFTNPRFRYERSGNPVETLSIFDATDVSFVINATGYAPDQAVAWLFIDSAFNNDLNFYDNYQSSRAAINTVGPGVIDNLIIGQATAITAIGGGDYETLFRIADIPLELQNENFRLLVIVYDSVNNIVNSFINPI